MTSKAVYCVIASHSDFNTYISHIRRKTVKDLLSIKDIDVVTRCTKELTRVGLIKVAYSNDFLHSDPSYKIVKLTDKFVFLKRILTKQGLSAKQLGLYASICSITRKGSDKCISSYLDCFVAKSTYYKYLKELETLNYIENDKGTVTLLCCIPNPKALSSIAEKMWDDCKLENECHKESEQNPIYKAIKEKEKSGWEDVTSPSNFIIKMLVGTTNKKKPTV